MLRYWLVLVLWLTALTAWAIPVTLANTGQVFVYAHPDASQTAIGQLTGGSQVDVIATDMTKGYLLINYQNQQAWILAKSVVNLTNQRSTDDSVQQVLNRALVTAGGKVGSAVNQAQSNLSSRYNHSALPGRFQALVTKQAREWFLLGAAVLLLGLVLGLLLGKIIWRPKRSFLR